MAEDKEKREEKDWRQKILDYFNWSNDNQETQNKNLEGVRGAVATGNQMLSNGFSRVSGVLREGFAPLFDLMDTGWSILSGIYNAVSGALIFIKGIPSLLGLMWGYFKRKEKREMREVAGQGWFGRLVGAISAAAFGIAAVLGGIAGKILLPFTMIINSIKSVWALIKETKLLQLVSSGIAKIRSWFTFIPNQFAKLFPTVTKVTGKITGFFGTISRVFGKAIGTFTRVARVVSQLPIIRSIIGGFITGFKKLAWPFQVIFSAIAFIRGFFGTEGDIIDKIKGGLMGVIKEFVALPSKLLGWIADWVFKQIGVEVPKGGSAQAIMDSIMNFSEMTIDAIMSPFRLIKSGLQKMRSFFTSTDEEKYSKLFSTIVDWAKGVPGAIKEWISGMLPSMEGIMGKLKGIGEGITGFFKRDDTDEIPGAKDGAKITKGGLVETHPAEIIIPQDLSKKLLKLVNQKDVDVVSKYEREKLSLYKQMRDQLTRMADIYQEQNNLIRNQQNSDESNNLSGMQLQKDPPDEIESMGLLLYNKSWGLG